MLVPWRLLAGGGADAHCCLAWSSCRLLVSPLHVASTGRSIAQEPAARGLEHGHACRICEQLLAWRAGKVRFMVSGSAPLSPTVGEFLRICFPDAVLLEGYGMTETTCVISSQVPVCQCMCAACCAQ